MTHRTLIAVALVALTALIAAPVAGAAAWQGPAAISDPASTAAGAPDISLGASGAAAASWWESSAGGRLALARRPVGGPWSAPVSIASTGSPLPVFTGVDAAGNVTAIWSTGGGASVTTIATWPVGAPAPTLAVIDTSGLDFPAPVTVTDLAVNASGAAVFAGNSGTDDVTNGYRATATGPFTLSQKIHVSANPARDAHVAINDAGDAALIYSVSNTIWTSRLSAASGAFNPSIAATTPDTPQDLTVAIDAGGNIYGAYTALSGLSRLVGAILRPVTADWITQFPLSPGGSFTTITADNVSLVVNRGGGAYLAWSQTGATALDSTISGRSGSTGTGAWGATESISAAGADPPKLAIGDDGTVVAAWERDSGTRTGQARVRTPAGAWGEVRALDSAHAGDTDLSVATDGRGHFAAITAPGAALVSTFDMVAPGVSPISLSGNAVATATLTFAVTPSDEWSPTTTSWTFGDGGTATGTTVTHVYDTAGTYTATATVTDGAGNATPRQLAVTVGALQSTLTSAKFSAKWKGSRVSGTLAVKGTAPLAGGYAVDVFSGKARKIHATFKLPAGAFSKTIKLPAKLLPGSYRVALTPSFPAGQVTPASRTIKLAAPIEGVVSTVTLSGTNGGPASKTLKGASTIWVTFRFASVPKGSLKLTWYRTDKGKRVALGSATKASGKKVGSYLKVGGLAKGTFTAVLSRKGKIIAQGSVKAT